MSKCDFNKVAHASACVLNTFSYEYLWVAAFETLPSQIPDTVFKYGLLDVDLSKRKFDCAKILRKFLEFSLEFSFP